MPVEIKMPDNLVEATFIKRLNRFVALVEVAGNQVKAHVPSSGRMREFLVTGAQVLLKPSVTVARRTPYTVLLVRYHGLMVSIDSLLPNRLLGVYLERYQLPGLPCYPEIRREVIYGGSRFDFLLRGGGWPDCLVEVKSVTLVEGGRALFPDAPSTRGARHLRELSVAREEGLQAAAVFIVQREDGLCFSPHDDRDPNFGLALREAARSGVSVLAFTCGVSPGRVALTGSIPVNL